jgi:hypothetical protein
LASVLPTVNILPLLVILVETSGFVRTMAAKLVGQFSAKRSDGGPVTVLVFRETTSGSDVPSNDVVPGPAFLRTRDGQIISRKGKGEYEMMDFHGTRLFSDDPNAI